MEQQKQIEFLLRSTQRFPPPPGVRFAYGTAGFRADASVLASTVFRAGILAALRSLETGSTVGLMITASHNPVDDNGVKIADPSGGMLTQQWEPFADALANAPSPEDLVQLVLEFVKKEKIPFGGLHSAHILLARDTRPSGEVLVDAAKQGVGALIGAVAIDMGILTTPQLHWMVRCRNKGLKASEFDYFTQLSKAFMTLIDLIPEEKKVDKYDKRLLVDAANGVGGKKLEEVGKMLTGLELHVRNSGEEGVLNDRVGADFVQKEKIAPRGFGPDDIGTRCASLDGDADRLVYFQVNSAGTLEINLIDGDKILSLFALFIKEQISILNEVAGCNSQFPVRLGIVQTAYANGASTKYLKECGLEVVFTPTGVKYLHSKASEYDIGIYFEANGHGTVLFSEEFLLVLEAKVNELSSESAGSMHVKAAQRLLAVSQLINQAVGDAISGFLLVEAILRHMGCSIEYWSRLYCDLPSRQLKDEAGEVFYVTKFVEVNGATYSTYCTALLKAQKVKVVDRNALVTTNAETQVVQPTDLQQLIDSETMKYPKGRCFIRPSGTEDVIRVYAEASSQEEADNLAKSMVQIVDRILGFSNS